MRRSAQVAGGLHAQTDSAPLPVANAATMHYIYMYITLAPRGVQNQTDRSASIHVRPSLMSTTAHISSPSLDTVNALTISHRFTLIPLVLSIFRITRRTNSAYSSFEFKAMCQGVFRRNIQKYHLFLLSSTSYIVSLDPCFYASTPAQRAAAAAVAVAATDVQMKVKKLVSSV